MAKLTARITAEENKIKKLYRQLGEKTYQMVIAKKEVPSSLQEDIRNIQESKRLIEDLKKRIKKVQGMQSCTACGAELTIDQATCPHCGAQLAEASKVHIPPNACKGCGTLLKPDTPYCPFCGTKKE